MKKRTMLTGLLPAALSVAVLGTAAAGAGAAEFSLFLQCQGKATANGSSTHTQLNLALRDNNQTALIQKSDALPVGERLKYDVSPATYSMTYKVPHAHSTAIYDWWRGQLFVWQPNLKRVTTVRLSIDRQSGGLSGEMLNADHERLATLQMQCEALDEQNLAPPKF